MAKGTPHAPQAQHEPPLVEFHYEWGGFAMSEAERKAYGTSGASSKGANCAVFQRREGAAFSRYARQMKEQWGL